MRGLRAQVDVYSFSMILYQLFEHTPPFAGVDPVEAARQAALYDKRPNLMQLGESRPFPMGVSVSAWALYHPSAQPHQELLINIRLNCTEMRLS